MHDEPRQLPDVVAVLVTDQQCVHVSHRQTNGVEPTQQPAHADPAVDQQDRSRRPHEERIPGAATPETRYRQQPLHSYSVSRRQAFAYVVQGTLTAARR